MLLGAMLVTVANAIPTPATSTDEATTSQCQAAENKYCSRGAADCSSCLQTHSAPLMAAGCHADDFADFCMPWICATQEAKLCSAAKRHGQSECSACLQTHSATLMKADCHADDFVDFCADATDSDTGADTTNPPETGTDCKHPAPAILANQTRLDEVMGMEAPIKAGDVPVPADLAELRNYVSLCSDGPGLANSCSNCRSAVAIGCDVGAAGCTAAICKFSGGSLCFFAGPVCAGIARWGCNPQRVCEFIGYCSSETDELVALEVAAAEEHQQAANDLETAILTASRSCGECSRRECVPSCTPPYDTSSRCRSCLQNCGCRVSSTTEDFVAAVGIVMKTPAAAEDVALEIAAAAEH